MLCTDDALRMARDQYERSFRAAKARIATLESLEQLRTNERDAALAETAAARREAVEAGAQYMELRWETFDAGRCADEVFDLAVESERQRDEALSCMALLLGCLRHAEAEIEQAGCPVDWSGHHVPAALYRESRTRIAELMAHRSQLQQEFDDCNADRECAVGDWVAACNQRDEARSERDEARSERDEARNKAFNERDEARLWLDKAFNEREGARLRLDKACSERDEARSERDALCKQLSVSDAQVGHFIKCCDERVAERDKAREVARLLWTRTYPGFSDREPALRDALAVENSWLGQAFSTGDGGE